MKKPMILSIAALALSSALCLAQDAPTPAAAPPAAPAGGHQGPPGGGGPGGDRGGRGQWNPEQMQQRMMDAMKDRLAATPDEWKVIQPRLQTVMEKERALRELSSRGGMFGRRGPQGTDNTPAEVAALDKALEAKDNAAIKTALEALRKVRTAKEADVTKAKTALREVLSVSQEARLVAMGMLD